MAKKTSGRSTPARSAKPSKPAQRRATVSGPTRSEPPRAGDTLGEKAAGTEDLAAAFPFNANKPNEYDLAASLAPHEGPSVEPDDPIVGSSTITEANGSEKTGSGAPAGDNPLAGPLDRVRVAHVVPGIDFSNDPLLAGRIHSYVDTQIYERETDPPRV